MHRLQKKIQSADFHFHSFHSSFVLRSKCCNFTFSIKLENLFFYFIFHSIKVWCEKICKRKFNQWFSQKNVMVSVQVLKEFLWKFFTRCWMIKKWKLLIKLIFVFTLEWCQFNARQRAWVNHENAFNEKLLPLKKPIKN